jgi:hypothetical protein
MVKLQWKDTEGEQGLEKLLSASLQFKKLPTRQAAAKLLSIRQQLEHKETGQ